MTSKAGLEEALHARTVDLLQRFEDDVDAQTSGNFGVPENLTSLIGVATNTIRLLREVKANTVRAEQADPTLFDAEPVKAALDSAIERVFEAKADWRVQQAEAALAPAAASASLTAAHSVVPAAPAEVADSPMLSADESESTSEAAPPLDDVDTLDVSDLTEKLEALTRLRQSGVLTKKEFRHAKARLISQ